MSNLVNFVSGINKSNIRDISTSKDRIRNQIIDTIVEKSKGKSEIKVLTLPSIWWNFEKLLITKIRENNQQTYCKFVSCERIPKLFKLSCLHMLKTKTGLKHGYASNIDCEVLSSAVAKLMLVDVFQYIERTNVIFDFIWLDTTSPLNSFIERLHHIDKCTKPGSIVSITFVKGRDSKEYVGQRKIILSKLMYSLNFELLDFVDYKDTSPMTHMNFIKN